MDCKKRALKNLSYMLAVLTMSPLVTAAANPAMSAIVITFCTTHNHIPHFIYTHITSHFPLLSFVTCSHVWHLMHMHPSIPISTFYHLSPIFMYKMHMHTDFPLVYHV